MATKIWLGHALGVQQESRATPANVEIGDVFTLTVNAKSVSFTATAATVANVTAGLTSAWNAQAQPELAEITASDQSTYVRLLADTAGKPFTVIGSTTDGGGTNNQTLTVSTPTASSGPNDWSTAVNWSGGTIPAGGDDVVIENSAVSILYGLDQSGITLASLSIKQNFTGRIGLARTNADASPSYVEYRQTYLKIGATTINIGQGEGAGSGRIKLDTGAVQITLNVFNSGSPAENGIKAILWVGTHASNTVNIDKGSFGAAAFGGEAATIATLREGYRTNAAGDSDVLLGSGCTLTTIQKTGGSLEINSNFTTLTQSAGETILQAGQPGTINLNGGALRYRSPLGATTINVADGAELDFRQDMRAKTIANLNLYSGAVLHDPFEVATITGGYILNRCSLSEVTLDIGTDITVARS